MGSRYPPGRSRPEPPGNKRKRKTLDALAAARELELYTYQKCRSQKTFPKKDRWQLPATMQREATDITSAVMDANDFSLYDIDECVIRIRRQEDALRAVRKLAWHITMAYRLHFIDDRVFKYWAGLADKTKNLILGWHKSDKGRLAER